MSTPPFSRPSFRSRAEALALLALVGLLAVLAVIQNRWLGAIAEAERRKLTEEAGEKAVTIAEDVDRELTRAFLELRIDAKMLEPKAGPAYAEQVARFRADASHQAMVKDIFVVDRAENAADRLLRFDASARVFVETAWPDVLLPVRAAIDAGTDSPLPLPLPLDLALPPVLPDVPALLSPVMNVIVSEKGDLSSPPKAAQLRKMLFRHAGRGPIEILLLDPGYLRQTLVGGAASARLGSEGPFTWSVVNGRNGSVVMGPGASLQGAPDAKAPLLRLRFDDLDRSLLRGVLPGLGETASDSSIRLVVQMSDSRGAMHPGGAGSASAPWTLQVRHREGSIDAAVRSQQRRNTVLSASILGVLGLSAGLVFFSARRLRQVATRQVEFVAAVSHELRTPLAVIRSAADNLADGVVHEKGQAQRYGALIRNESLRLSDMVEHVLEFAGADSPGRSARGPIDATEAVRSAVSSMAASIAERRAQVDVAAPDEPVRVNGDLSHLTRAISNLVGNALKYGGDAPQIEIRVERRDSNAVLAVADSGAGLEPAEISHLFEPFYRGRRASETQVPGSGLGLALVKSIVEGHGGRVNAMNRAEGGALFTIELPSA
jgi:two-component system sensor histidine kinase SenX3